jgi:hypothetical protein
MLEIALKVFGPVLAVMVFFSIMSFSRRNEKVTATSDIVLKHNWMLKSVPWICLCAAIGFPILGFIQNMRIHGNPGAIGHYMVVIGLFLSFAVYLLPEAYFVKFTVSGTTIFCESPWRKNRRIEVSDIVKVSFSQALKYYNLKTRNDGIIRVYMYMNGVPRFLDFLERQLKIEIERYY